MRAVVQRVTGARVSVDGDVKGSVGAGMCVLLGVEAGDGDKDLEYIVDKVSGLRIFDDENGVMNRSILDTGKRPSWIKAERPEEANAMYMRFNEVLRAKGIRVEEGVFQAEMLVEIHNDGPVTILLDSKKTF